MVLVPESESAMEDCIEQGDCILRLNETEFKRIIESVSGAGQPQVPEPV